MTVLPKSVTELGARPAYDVEAIRADFPILAEQIHGRPLVYLDNGASAQKPKLVLDTIDRAREHEEVEGGFKAVADQLEKVVAGLGLTRFGEPGDEFDPNLHEALSHLGTDPEVSVVTCKHIAKAGYKIGDRVVRAAQVLVVDPVDA